RADPKAADEDIAHNGSLREVRGRPREGMGESRSDRSHAWDRILRGPARRPQVVRIAPLGSVRLAGDRFPGDLAQGVPGGALLRVLLGPSPGGREPPGPDLGRDLEALEVIGPFLVQQLVDRSGPELSLRGLL